MGEPIPFANFQASGLEALGGASPCAMNVVIEPPAPTGKAGVVRRRPGIRAYSGAYSGIIDSGGIQGLFTTEDGAIFAVGGTGPERGIYSITAASAPKLGGGIVGTGLRGSGRPIFVETQMLVVIAGGAEIQKVERATLASSRLGGSPPLATHVVGNSSRLLANDPTVDTAKIKYSDIAQGNVTFTGNETWSGFSPGPGGTVPGFFSAEARPDPLLALYENTNEIYAWGTNTLQTFAPDGQLVYAPASTIEYGISAPYSVVKSDGKFYWLDNQKRIVMSDGRSVSVISEPIQRQLDAMALSTDCWGFRVVSGPFTCLVFVFPSDGRTFVYQDGAGWGQWQGWNGNWTQFNVNASWLRDYYNAVLVGTLDGRVGELSLDAATDFGNDIRAYVQTGYQNHGTDASKNCLRVHLALKRGITATGPLGWLQWRDRPGPWTGRIPVDFGGSGDTEIVLTYPSLGVYRRRQWAFEFSAGSDLSLVSAIEEFEVQDF